MDSFADIRLLFRDSESQTHDLLQKLKVKCNEAANSSQYKSLMETVKLLRGQVTEYIPALRSAVGTLSLQICLPVTECFSTLSVEAEEQEQAVAASADPISDSVPRDSLSVPVAENSPHRHSNTVKLGALKINPRPLAEETATPEKFVDCIDLRADPVSSASPSPVTDPRTPMLLERSHCQVSQTQVSASLNSSFVDLNPSPLPTPDKIADSLLLDAQSLLSKFGQIEEKNVFDVKRCVRKLGHGGGGKVVLCLCPNWTVAVKSVYVRPEKQEFLLKEIEREGEIMRDLTHPNVLGYFGSQLIDDNYTIITEWMPGGSLKDLIRQSGPFRDKELLHYSYQLLSGIKYLHDSKIVHRDIKGDNLFIGSCGQLKIGDFGNAQYMDHGMVHCYVEGTPYFMAPEYVRNGEYKPSCDIWSAGCTMIEMATGRPPWPQWESLRLEQLTYQLGNAEAPPVVPKFLTDPVRDLISSCLQLDPSRRPTAGQLLSHEAFSGSYIQCDPPATEVADLPSVASVHDSHPSI